MARQTLPETEARRLLNGGVVTLVTTSWHGGENIAPVIWHTPLSVVPPLVGIAVHPSRHTHDMIRFSENFVLNIPTPQLMRHVHYAGLVSGADTAKMEALRIPTLKASVVQSPLLQFCIGWIECGLEDAIRVGDHTLFVGRVVAVSVDDEAFDGLWKLEGAEEQRPLHYVGGPYYAALGPRVEAQLEREETEAGEETGRFMPPAEESEEEREQREERE